MASFTHYTNLGSFNFSNPMPVPEAARRRKEMSQGYVVFHDELWFGEELLTLPMHAQARLVDFMGFHTGHNTDFIYAPHNQAKDRLRMGQDKLRDADERLEKACFIERTGFAPLKTNGNEKPTPTYRVNCVPVLGADGKYSDYGLWRVSKEPLYLTPGFFAVPVRLFHSLAWRSISYGAKLVLLMMIRASRGDDVSFFPFSPQEIVDRFNCSRSKAQRFLKELQKEGFIYPSGNTRARLWRLNSQLPLVVKF